MMAILIYASSPNKDGLTAECAEAAAAMAASIGSG